MFYPKRWCIHTVLHLHTDGSAAGELPCSLAVRPLRERSEVLHLGTGTLVWATSNEPSPGIFAYTIGLMNGIGGRKGWQW